MDYKKYTYEEALKLMREKPVHQMYHMTEPNRTLAKYQRPVRPKFLKDTDRWVVKKENTTWFKRQRKVEKKVENEKLKIRGIKNFQERLKQTMELRKIISHLLSK